MVARLVDATGKPIPTERNLRTVMSDLKKVNGHDLDKEVNKKADLAKLDGTHNAEIADTDPCIDLNALGLTCYGEKDFSFEKFKQKDRSNPLLTKKD